MRRLVFWILAIAALGCGREPAGTAVPLPGGAGGLGFDDLRYSPSLHRVLVPGGRSGRLFLVDPDSLAVSSVPGFGVVDGYAGDHGEGPTSVDEGDGKLFVTDRTTRKLFVVDPAKLAIVAEASLAASPDYVRFVASRNELWVTEPAAASMEVFSLGADGVPIRDASFAVTNGPESLVIDETRGRAYAHRWQASTIAIDLKTRAIVAEWPNGCAVSRGIALDEARGFLFSGCGEGTVAVLDVAHDGKILSTMAKGSGFDVIGYSSALGHLYLAGKTCACLVTLGVSGAGVLSFLDRVDAPTSTHCVTADDTGHAWVCDPNEGQLWRVDDHAARSLR
jgi:hypothetical protein